MNDIKSFLCLLIVFTVLTASVVNSQNPYAIFGYEGVVYDVKKPEALDVSTLILVNGDSASAVHRLVLDFKNRVASTYNIEGLLLHEAFIPPGVFARWLTTDVYGQFHSPYIGMGNNPVRGIDPDGGYVFFLGQNGGLLMSALNQVGSLPGFDMNKFSEYAFSAVNHIYIKIGDIPSGADVHAETTMWSPAGGYNARGWSSRKITLNKEVLSLQPDPDMPNKQVAKTAGILHHDLQYHTLAAKGVGKKPLSDRIVHKKVNSRIADNIYNTVHSRAYRPDLDIDILISRGAKMDFNRLLGVEAGAVNLAVNLFRMTVISGFAVVVPNVAMALWPIRF